MSKAESSSKNASILDLVFLLDATGSMKFHIQNATENIYKVVQEIISKEECDIRMGLVEFRDHPPEELTFVTRSHDFTSSIRKMREWLENSSAKGGGDGPEAIADALYDALNLSWRSNATKICILVTDAPPHGLIGEKDHFPSGCPNGHDPMDIVKKMAKSGIVLYCVGCEPGILPFKDFFAAMALNTGGQYIPLKDANLLSKVIVGSTLEQLSLDKVKNKIRSIVEKLKYMGINDEFEMAKYVEQYLKSQKVTTRNLVIDNQILNGVDEESYKMSKMKSLKEVSSHFRSRRKSMPNKTASVDKPIEIPTISLKHTEKEKKQIQKSNIIYRVSPINLDDSDEEDITRRTFRGKIYSNKKETSGELDGEKATNQTMKTSEQTSQQKQVPFQMSKQSSLSVFEDDQRTTYNFNNFDNDDYLVAENGISFNQSFRLVKSTINEAT